MIKVKTEAQERKDSFIAMIFWCCIWLVMLNYLTACNNYKLCLSNTSIDEINEVQKLSKKP